MRRLLMSAAVAVATIAAAAPAYAGSETGNFMVRVQGTVVDPDSSATVKAGGVVQSTWDAEVSTEVIPTLTLSYFLNKNIAVELFCCFAKMNAEGKGDINGMDLGDFWIFPPRAEVSSFTSSSVTFGSSPSVCPLSMRITSATTRPSLQPL